MLSFYKLYKTGENVKRIKFRNVSFKMLSWQYNSTQWISVEFHLGWGIQYILHATFEFMFGSQTFDHNFVKIKWLVIWIEKGCWKKISGYKQVLINVENLEWIYFLFKNTVSTFFTYLPISMYLCNLNGEKCW